MSGINRFLSRREKRSSKTKDKPRFNSDDLQVIFSVDEDKKLGKEDEKKIQVITQQLARLGITSFKQPQVEYALRSPYSDGDVEKAFEMLVLFEDSQEGIVKDYDPRINLLGAVNREGVTCYLDALLFAMFARLDSFEAMLYNSFDDEPRRKLAALLRLWANMLRLGKLITTDITQQLQETLAKCGWEEAAELRQQDASEAFTFITEKLELPLLTLKMDIYHTGKEDADDDHKFVNERLLEVAIPPPDESGNITLEDCLEEYFNNRIEVRRYLERRGTVSSNRSTEKGGGHAVHIETVDLGSGSGSRPSTPSSPATPISANLPHPPHSLSHRSPSIIRDLPLEEGEPSIPVINGEPLRAIGRKRTNSVRKEIMMPAWQFFSLIPFYTENVSRNAAQVAAHFSTKRPVLGLCLKRYSMLPNGKAVRLNTHVDIPREIGLPHFIKDDQMDDDAPLFGNFKLSLQSVVCHRGVSVDSGHYISLVRGQAPNAGAQAAEQRPQSNSSGEEPEDTWMRFDDMAKERVSYVDIKQALKDESPYLLFYQVQPIDDSPPYDPHAERPPSYEETHDRDSGVAGLSLKTGASFGSVEEDETSRKPSFEVTAPDGDRRGRTSMSSERRMSIAFTDGSGSLRLDNATTPGSVTPSEENGGNSAVGSRRGSKISKDESKSRPSSQSGEKMMNTLSRLSGRLSRDKLTVPDVVGGDAGPPSTGEPSTTTKDEAGEKGGITEEKGKSTAAKKERKKLRSRSRQRLKDMHEYGKRKAMPPDRECSIM
ncbi:MAG: hypothetical protein M1819_007127 [Sarea resinae]|nr:MAG: hypothetical protein M1819_007127 [Sarea resinae]